MNVLGGTRLKASCCLSFLLFSAAVPSGYCFAADSGDLQAMTRFASSNLSEILSNIPAGKEKDYGFLNQDELKEATLGIPYQEYDMEKEKPTGYWRVPVTVEGKNRALLRLKSTADGWTFSGFGGGGLARNLDEHQNKMLREGKNPQTGRIVRDFSMKCDYVQFDQQPDAALSGSVYPLKSASRFISTFGAASSASVGSSGGYDLDTIKQMRLKAREMKENPDSFDNSNLGGK